MGKNTGVFVALNVVLLVFFLKFIPRVFELNGKAFVGEFLLLGLFLAVALIAMAGVYFDLDFSFPLLLVFFAVTLVNTLFLYFNFGFRLYNYVLLSFVGLLGFIISLNKLDKQKYPKQEPRSIKHKLPKNFESFKVPDPLLKELHEKVSDPNIIFEDVEFEKADQKEVAELQKYHDDEKASAEKSSKEKPKSSIKYSTAYSPGKFVASKSSTSYHAPKCEWAEKISKKNRVWLASKEDAKKKGYKAHSCLK